MFVHEGLGQWSERRSVIEQISKRFDVVVTFLEIKKCGRRIIWSEGIGVAVCVSDEHGDAVLRVSLRHDPNSVSSVGLVPILCHVVPVRCVCVEHRSGVGDSSAAVDSSVCDV